MGWNKLEATKKDERRRISFDRRQWRDLLQFERRSHFRGKGDIKGGERGGCCPLQPDFGEHDECLPGDHYSQRAHPRGDLHGIYNHLRRVGGLQCPIMARFSAFGALDSPHVEEGDAAFVRMVSRLRPSQLQPGEVSDSRNGRMGTDQEWTSREGWDAISGALAQEGVPLRAVGLGETGVIPLFADLTIDSGGTNARASNVVTITTTAAHGRSTGETVRISGLTGFTEDPNGNRIITSTPTSTTFTYAHTGTDESFTYSSPVVTTVQLEDSTLVEVLGACKFSDPSDSNEEYILIATTNEAIAYKLSDDTTTTISYPGGATLSARCNMEQSFGSVYLWRGAGSTAWVWDGDLSGSPAFAAVASGAKTQQTIYQTAGNTVVSSGVATVTETAHGRSVGDEVLVVSTALTGQSSGEVVKIATVPGANSFTYYMDGPDNAGASVVYSTGGSSLGGGFINMPAAEWGVYHQRRIWLPYTHDDAASPAARNVQDELIASDILDGETYDPISNQFRITAGTADYLVAVHPFNEDNLIAFNRNSIHLLKGVSGALDDVETVQITDELGCVARKSIVTHGNQVLFLSDKGVFALSFIDEYNLRGTEIPISEDIQDKIDRMTDSQISEAVAIYHDNRYWLWCGLDGNTENSSCLIYNFLNKGWESEDSTEAASFSALEAIESRASKRNELYVVTEQGTIVKITNTSRVTDSLVNYSGDESLTAFDVSSFVKTRQFVAGTLERKKWSTIESHVRGGRTSAADGSYTLITEDPDTETQITTITEQFGEEITSGNGGTIRARCGNIRGYGAQVKFTPSEGRPRLRTVKVRGIVNARATTSEN